MSGVTQVKRMFYEGRKSNVAIIHLYTHTTGSTLVPAIIINNQGFLGGTFVCLTRGQTAHSSKAIESNEE